MKAALVHEASPLVPAAAPAAAKTMSRAALIRRVGPALLGASLLRTHGGGRLRTLDGMAHHQTRRAAACGHAAQVRGDQDGRPESLVVVALNPSKTDRVPYSLDIGGGHVAAISIPARSLQTILVPPAA